MINCEDLNSTAINAHDQAASISNTTKRKCVKKVYEKVPRMLRSSSNPILSAFCILPSSFKDSTLTSAGNHWEDAQKQEFESLKLNKPRILVPRPRSANVIKCDFVHASKYEPTTNKMIPKASLVAKGYVQVHGIDYTDTCAPTMHIISIKLYFCKLIILML